MIGYGGFSTSLSQGNVRQTYDIRAITLVITQMLYVWRTFTWVNLSKPSVTYRNLLVWPTLKGSITQLQVFPDLREFHLQMASDRRILWKIRTKHLPVKE